MNKKQKNNTYAINFTAAARRLGVSVCTVQRLVKKGILHATEPQLRRHHWTRGIRVDKAFEAERARRLNGLKAPRRKHIPTAIDPLDPSPIQTVTETVVSKTPEQQYYTFALVKLTDKAEQCANKASQKEEQCDLSVKHASEWCDKAQKAYIACAKERQGSLRCAAWCTIACIIAAIILIADLSA